MSVMPADAPRSDDGQWWWDGAQWQPVDQAAGAATDAQPAPGAAAPSSTEGVGELSEDGQWRWDGTQWQPVSQDAGAAATDTGPKLEFGHLTAEAHTANDGTPAILFTYTVTNSGTTAIDPGKIQAGYFVLAEGATAEAAAYSQGEVLSAIAPGEEHQGHSPVQADPGTWTVWVALTDATTGQQLTQSENVTVHVAGAVAASHDFDETQTYALTVTITQFEHVQGALFRIHYDLQSDRDVPAGLNVSGKIAGETNTSAQLYDLTTAVTAGQARAHHLTLESDKPAHVTASITVDPGGPSEKADSVEVDIAEDGTSTISR
jgi:hypothetical protein